MENQERTAQMITGKDFRKVIIYLYNVSYEEFMKDILNKEFSDGYVKEKWRKLQEYPFVFIGKLDESTLDRIWDNSIKKYKE